MPKRHPRNLSTPTKTQTNTTKRKQKGNKKRKPQLKQTSTKTKLKRTQKLKHQIKTPKSKPQIIKECHLFSTDDIIRLCDVYHESVGGYFLSSNENLDLDPMRLSKANTVYICTDALNAFVRNYLPNLSHPIVLVTGNSDITISSDPKLGEMFESLDNDVVLQLLNSPIISKWFAQNCFLNHFKVTRMPIGICPSQFDGSTFLRGLRHNKPQANNTSTLCNIARYVLPVSERIPKIYTTFQFELFRGDRLEALQDIPADCINYEETQIDNVTSFINQANYAFVASPFGRGPDCYRTWEALALGCIPIMKSSLMDPLFHGLPVLLIEKWSDVNQEMLNNAIKHFKTSSKAHEKLRLSYWQGLIDPY